MAGAEHCGLWACAHHSHCSPRWCQPQRAASPAGAANCHSNHPQPEPPGTSFMKGRSCRAERLNSPSLFSSGLTGELLEVQASALHSIIQFKWISAFNSNHIATGSKGKSTPWQLPTQSINLQNSTLLQLTQLGEQSLQTRVLSMQGMSPTVQLRPFWFVLGFSQENFASSTTESTCIMKIFKDNWDSSKNKTPVWSGTSRFHSSVSCRVWESLSVCIIWLMYLQKNISEANYASNQSPASHVLAISYFFLYFVNVVLNSNEKVHRGFLFAVQRVKFWLKERSLISTVSRFHIWNFKDRHKLKERGSTGEYDI